MIIRFTDTLVNANHNENIAEITIFADIATNENMKNLLSLLAVSTHDICTDIEPIADNDKAVQYL
jgi:hypothetical protein